MPLVPGFTTSGELSANATGSAWLAVRILDGHRFVLKVLPVADATEAQTRATDQMAVYDRINSEHLVRRHSAIALADGTLALVLDEVSGGTLAQLLGARGQLTAGETVTTIAPLFGALADLHAAGVLHGTLAPGSVLFSEDGRPLIGDLGFARLLGRDGGLFDGTGAEGFVAPELVDGVAPSPETDVYAMAAVGWFCLTGAPPAPAARRPSLTTLRPEIPSGLVEVITACLAADPAERPSAGSAAAEVFDAAPAESVALVPVSDPAADITRRIRAAAAVAPDSGSRGTGRAFRTPLVLAVVAALMAVALGTGLTWFFRGAPASPHQEASASATQFPLRPATQLPLQPATAPTIPAPSALSVPVPRNTSEKKAAPTKTAKRSNEVVAAYGSPRTGAAGLLQALVDARALAYVARDSALLDLVYAPGAPKADVDKGNIATALKSGGTYLGLSFVVRDVVYLDGTSRTARVRATILTPAYRTGQPDGRKVAHVQESLGPAVFSLSLTPDGWRILTLTAP